MGFVKDNIVIEEYLDRMEATWQPLGDTEYKKLMEKWQKSFEELLLSSYRKYGDEAIVMLEARLGVSAYIFSAPNYRCLPSTSSKYDYTYAYHVEKLCSFDRDIFDAEEAIVCDDNFTFMCAFNHEGKSLIPETYCEIEKDQ